MTIEEVTEDEEEVEAAVETATEDEEVDVAVETATEEEVELATDDDEVEAVGETDTADEEVEELVVLAITGAVLVFALACPVLTTLAPLVLDAWDSASAELVVTGIAD